MSVYSIYNVAENLCGQTVGNWHVGAKYSHPASSGGNFSVGYEAANISTGEKGFLKALDYSSAMGHPDTVDRLNAMTAAYIFERDLLNKCSNKRLKYIIRIVDSGQFVLPAEQYPHGTIVPYPQVDYIVLEMADRSIRNMIDLSVAFDYAWALRSLHNVAVGIEEMHGIQVAHQDIKPSNVLLFDEKQISKLGDVGRASSLETPAKHDEFPCAGDPIYSPFEQLYGDVDRDWKVRRYSCDMFMFGNLIMTYFNNISITAAVMNKLPENSWPRNWGDTYSDILPQIEKAFAECLDDFNHNVDESLRAELVEIIRQLCCPDISKRGDMKNSHLSGGQQYSLRRYITKLDLLASKWELQLKRGV